MPFGNRLLSVALAFALASPAVAQSPYYRLKVQGGQAEDGGQVNNTTSNPVGTLAVTPSPDLPSSVASGSSVNGRYVATGGLPPYNFSWGSLAPGLAQSANLLSTSLSGVPTLPGRNGAMTLTVTDSNTPPASVTFRTAAFTLGTPASPLSLTANPNFASTVVQGGALDARFQATGGTAPYAFSIDSPVPGTSLSTHNTGGGYGELSGTASTVGSVPASTITVTDSSTPPQTATYGTTPFTVTARTVPPPVAKPLALAAGPDVPASVATGTHVAATYAASGGTPPYSFTYGSPAPGLGWSATATSATLSGIPTQLGANPGIAVTVTDSASPANTASLVTHAFTLAAKPAVSLTMSANPDFPTSVRQGTQVRAEYTATGGTAPYTFTLDGTLPGVPVSGTFGGSQWGPGTVDLQGTPSTTGVQTPVTVTATDSSTPPVTGTYSTPAFDVVPLPPAPLYVGMSPEIPSTVASGVNQSFTYTYGGGTAPYAATLSSIPTGMAFAPADDTHSILSGTPADGGYNAITLTVTDSANPPATATYVAQSFTVQDPSTPAVVVTASPAFLPTVGIGSSDYAYLQFQGGTGPYTVSVGSTPADVAVRDLYDMYKQYFPYQVIGLTYSPTSIETLQPITVTVTDANGLTGSYTTNVVQSTPSTAAPLAVTPNNDLPSQVAYAATVFAGYTVTGGSQPYAIQASTPIAPGFTSPTLDNRQGWYGPGYGDIELSGTPTAVGSNPGMTFIVTDSLGASATFTTNPFTLLPPPPIVIVASPDLPSSTPLGDQVSAYYPISGGVPPYTASYDAAPAGLTVSVPQPGDYQPTFSITGFPTAAGTDAPVTFTVTDSYGQALTFATDAMTVSQLGDATHLALYPNPELPTSVSYGASVSASYEVFGGTPPYQATFGGLPAGLSASPVPKPGGGGYFDTWIVSGTPTTVGANQGASITVTDSAGNTLVGATGPFTLGPGSASPLSVSGFFYVGTDYGYTGNPEITVAPGTYAYGRWVASGGLAPVTLALQGSAPGLNATVDGPTLTLIGGASTPGEVTLSIVATDAAGNTASQVVPPYIVDGGANANLSSIAFSTVGDLQNLTVGDPVSVPFAETGGILQYNYSSIQFSVAGAPAGMYMDQVNYTDTTATLSGVASQPGTYAPVVSVTDGISSASYQMQTFNVKPKDKDPGGLCIINPFSFGQAPEGDSRSGVTRLSYEWARVGCGVEPYTAVVTGGTGDIVANQAPCTFMHCGVITAGVIMAARTGQDQVVTVYDSAGNYATFPPLTLSKALVPTPYGSDLPAMYRWIDAFWTQYQGD